MKHYYINGEHVSEAEFERRGGDKSKAARNGIIGAGLQIGALACLAAGPIGWAALGLGIVGTAVGMTIHEQNEREEVK